MLDVFLAVVTSIIQIPQIKNWAGYGYLTGFQLMRSYRVITGIPQLNYLVVHFTYLNSIFFFPHFLVQLISKINK